jgi:ATP-dependent RNA helicase DDX19/DBP5
MIVVDEADHFFGNENDRDKTTRLISQADEKVKGLQKLFFSATYNEEVTAAIKKIIPENSISIRLKNKALTLKGVKQMYFVCKGTSKFEIIEDLFNEFDNTQMIVFVNTKKFAERAHHNLTNKGYKASIITGNVEPEERDKIMQQFRKRELQFVFATNVLSRGIDISDMKLMINLDIPSVLDNDGFLNADCENYLHRIGRTGRFDTKGLALTIIDGGEERYEKEMECLKQIQETYESEIKQLEKIEDLPDIYKEHCEN